MAEETPRPNLFIVGAMKSGTSSLHRYLSRHPQVFMCEPKEPCYFVEPSQLSWPAIEKLGTCGNERRYLELFENASGARVVGESSTLYSKLPRITGVAQRIARFDPRAHIVYLMRDPVERSISHYWHAVRWEGEHRTLDEAIRAESHYLEVSHYSMQLEPYLRHFGEHRVLALTTEELAQGAEATLRRICSWLGIDPEGIAGQSTDRANVTPEVVSQVRGRGYLEGFRWSPMWNLLGPLFPASLRSIGRRAAARRVDRSEPSDSKTLSFLRSIQQPQVRELERLLGRSSFEREWTTLFGDY